MNIRSRVTFGAVLTITCLGTIDSWSLFTPALERLNGWSKPQLALAIFLAVGSFGLTAALASSPMQRLGPKLAVKFSAALFAIGTMGAGLAVRLHSLALLYVVYGVIGGIGLGMAFVPSVTVLMRWFSDRKGRATGLVVGGFVLGALLASFVVKSLLNQFTCSESFVILGLAYGMAILLGSSMLPEHMTPAAPDHSLKGPASLLESRSWPLFSIPSIK